MEKNRVLSPNSYMNNPSFNPSQWALPALILIWLGWQLAVPVELLGSDLGRHVKNGELICHGQWDVFYKNYYSYTHPDYPFLNYHWLFGVFCYGIWYFCGFTGLGLVYVLLGLLSFYLFFHSCRRQTSLLTACAVGLLSFPFLSFRSEIRPEGLSYLFCGIFWWSLESFRQKRFNARALFLWLCCVQVIWANTHIFFILGPLLVLLYALQARMNQEQEQAWIFFRLSLGLLSSCLINPFGFKIFGVLFDTWGKSASFPIVESFPVWKILQERITLYWPVLFYFMASAALLLCALIYLIRRDGFRNYALVLSLFLLLSAAAMKTNRLIGLYGFLGMPAAALAVHQLTRFATETLRKNLEIMLLGAGVLVSLLIHFDVSPRHGLGIVSSSNQAAEFFKQEHLTGPIFNNYGIGGYLIFHLSPREKLFIDNRGEAAFPAHFVSQTYKLMQWKDSIWHIMDGQYHFNVIFCSPERSYWAERFLENRLADPEWALVFFDQGARIFVRRNAGNADTIRRYEIHVLSKQAQEVYARAMAEARQGQWPQALSDFNQTLDIDPHYADAYSNRGFIYGSQGQLAQALADFNKAIALNPHFGDAYNNRAFAYFQLKEYQKAWEDVQTARTLGTAVNPGFIDALKRASGENGF